MATRVSDRDGDRYRAAQRAVTSSLTRDVKRLRRLIISSRLRSSIPSWIDAVRAVVGEYGSASAALAADFYDEQRVAAQVTGRFTVPLLGAPPDEQVANSLRWATKDLWPRDPDDPVTTEAQKQPMDVRLDEAEKKAEAVAQKLVVDQGRGTMQGAVQADSQAVAWARSAALGACAFCRMLAVRGAVFGQDTVDFRAHDGCHCMVIPVFKGQRFELSDKAKEWERLYREYAAPYSGDQLRRFRRAVAEHG